MTFQPSHNHFWLSLLLLFTKWKMKHREARLYSMLVLTGSFFVVEIVVGYLAGSIALVADSFHMLSDVMGLVIALYAIRLGKQTEWKPQLTFGWQRAEVLGALINGVFLLALTFMVTLEAIQRFFSPVEIDKPQLVLIVGGVGLCINVLGLLLFHDHAHGHSHSHNHGSSETIAVDKPTVDLEAGSSRVSQRTPLPDYPLRATIDVYKKQLETPIELTGNVTPSRQSSPEHEEAAKHQHAQDSHLNMKGVFLHVLGDALGSLAVIVSALIIWLCTGWANRYIIDPLLSLVIVLILLGSTIPLVKTTCMILMQATPSTVPVDIIRQKILGFAEIHDVHEFHIWQLSDQKTVGSVHVVVDAGLDFMPLADRIKALLHGYGVHSMTVQPEYLNGPNSTRSSRKDTPCLLPCVEPACTPQICCDPAITSPSMSELPSNTTRHS
jgi:zinc transporter 1